jgi:hypothetical protein
MRKLDTATDDRPEAPVTAATPFYGPPFRAKPQALTALTALYLLVSASAEANAQVPSPGWTVGFASTYVDPRGHDQHVLTIHRTDLAAQATVKEAVTLDTESGAAYRGSLRYSSGRWAVGGDFFWFATSQSTGDPARTGGGAGEEVAFEVADRRFTSSDPSQRLFHRLLEDTDVAMWTLDLLGMRILAETPATHLALSAGVRFADFDNDYRAVAGIEGVEGVRFDASSNYGRLTGPVLGIAGDWRTGRARLSGNVSQAVVLGAVELTGLSREFTGGSEGALDFVSSERLEGRHDVAIPITEVRIRVAYQLLDRVALAGGVQASTWWDVAVPPGVRPMENGDETLHENTLVFFGVGGGVEITW